MNITTNSCTHGSEPMTSPTLWQQKSVAGGNRTQNAGGRTRCLTRVRQELCRYARATAYLTQDMVPITHVAGKLLAGRDKTSSAATLMKINTCFFLGKEGGGGGGSKPFPQKGGGEKLTPPPRFRGKTELIFRFFPPHPTHCIATLRFHAQTAAPTVGNS